MVDIVSVALARIESDAMTAAEKSHDTLAGTSVQTNVTGPFSRPDAGVTLIVEVPELPRSMVNDGGDAWRFIVETCSWPQCGVYGTAPEI
jgi:hypothetical protein